LKSLIAKGKEKLKFISIEKGYEGAEGIIESEITPEEERTHYEIQTYLDPPDSQCKGRRRKPVRFQSPIEKKAKKMRTCGICNAKEGHNARTCPQVFEFVHIFFSKLLLEVYFNAS
jgi:hypothetical protein